MVKKRQFNKETILGSVDIENTIKNNIATTIKKMWQFSFDEHGNNRSSAKTDLLHKSWENVLKDSFGDYQDLFLENFGLVVEKENAISKKTDRIKQIVDIFGSKFKVDMLMTQNGRIRTVFLLKAPLTSLNKNRYNSALNNFGEIDRFYGNPENRDIELVFVNFTPKVTFTIDDKKNAIKSETVQYLGLNIDDNGERPLDKLPKAEEIKQKIHEIHIEYNVVFNKSLSDLHTKNDLREQIKISPNFISLEHESMKELKNYIEYFITTNNHILHIDLNVEDVPSLSKTQMKLKFH